MPKPEPTLADYIRLFKAAAKAIDTAWSKPQRQSDYVLAN